MAIISLNGFFDLHVHTAPAPFRRVGDTSEVGRWCAEMGMRGMVTKSHLESTVAKAYHANKDLNDEFPNFKVYASIALNRSAGGINPAAVEAVLDQGGKIVWFPTFDAAFHIQVHGSAGSYGTKNTSLNFRGGDFDRGSYTVLD